MGRYTKALQHYKLLKRAALPLCMIGVLAFTILPMRMLAGNVSAQEPPPAPEEECTEERLKNLQVAILNCAGDEEMECTIVSEGGVDGFLRALAQQESGGNPTAEAGTSSASGKYQYIDSTWRARAGLYGPSGNYSRASQAPEAVQDAVAYIEYSQKFRNAGNDLFNLAVSHFYPAALSDASLLDIVPPGNVLTPREYANRLLQNIQEGVGSNIPLLYNEAPEFLTWLERAGGPPDGSTPNGGTCDGASLGEVQCPSVLEAHPSRAGYFKMPVAPNDEYLVYSVDERRYGSRELVCAIYSVALAYNQAMGGRSRLRIGDLNGGAPHRSHRWGVAVDLSAFGEIQAASWTASWKGTYSKEATIELGKLWIDTGMVRNIWWCPPSGDDSTEQILAYAQQSQGGIEGSMHCIDGHADHFHVDIKAEFRLEEWAP